LRARREKEKGGIGRKTEKSTKVSRIWNLKCRAFFISVVAVDLWCRTA